MPVTRLQIAIGLLLLSSSAAGAQALNPGPPGPFVIDVRGASSGVPSAIALYPSLTPTDFIVPTRGFGLDVGAHVYPFGIGPARVGIGANLVRVRGTSRDAEVTTQILAPQLSFNFGTANGWSFLSAGVGPARVDAVNAFNVQSVNAGGGARWFLNNHMAIGFDIRWHQLAAKDAFPQTTLVSAAVGLSFK